jgi:phage terminase Nu1 subunit (DNA packaging protein)
VATVIEVAHHIGVTPKYVQDLINEGVIERKGRGEYDLNECRDAYIKKLRIAASGRSSSGELDLVAERARLAKEQADSKEMENAITRGELVYIDDVAKKVEVALSNVKIRLLAVPTKAAPEAAAADDAKEVQALIERHIIEALNELAGIDPTKAG